MWRYKDIQYKKVYKVSIMIGKIGKGKYRKAICFEDWESIQAPRCLRPLVTFEPSSNCCPLLESLRTFLVSIFSVSSISVFGSFASLSFNLTTFTGATSLSSFDSRRSGRDLALTLLRLPATSGLRTRKNSTNLSKHFYWWQGSRLYCLLQQRSAMLGVAVSVCLSSRDPIGWLLGLQQLQPVIVRISTKWQKTLVHFDFFD